MHPTILMLLCVFVAMGTCLPADEKGDSLCQTIAYQQ
jgi:hypothetical protein